MNTSKRPNRASCSVTGSGVMAAQYGLDTPEGDVATVNGVVCFAGDLSEQEQKVVWATHYAPAADLFSRNAPDTAWKSKPTWYIVANNDRTVQPDLQRFLAKRMGATTHAIDSSHVPLLSHPGLVNDVIRAAAKAVRRSSATA